MKQTTEKKGESKISRALNDVQEQSMHFINVGHISDKWINFKHALLKG